MLFTFFAQISDPRFGGMYLTLLTSLNNMGRNWSCSVCLVLVDVLTLKSCLVDELKVSIVGSIYLVTLLPENQIDL